MIPGVCAVRPVLISTPSQWPLYRPTAPGRPNLRRRPFDGRSVARGPPCRDELPGQGHSAGGMPAALPSEGFRKTPALDPANGSIASPPDRADARRRSFGDDVSYRAPSPCGAWRRIESTPRKTAEKIGFVNSSSGSAHDSPHRCACPILARSLAPDAHTTGQPIRHELPIRCLPVIRRLPDPPRSRRLRAPHRPRRPP